MSLDRSAIELTKQAVWPLDRIKDNTWKIGSGITPSGGAASYLDTGIPLLRSQNVHFDGLKLDDVAYIGEEVHEVMSGTKLRAGDVLLNITGASIGRCSFVPERFGEGNVNQHVCIIRPSAKLNHKFLNYCLSAPWGQEQILSSFTGASRQGLGQRDLGEIRVPLPPLPEQERIVAYLDASCAAIDTAVAAKRRQIEVLDELCKSTIEHAVTKGLAQSTILVDTKSQVVPKVPNRWKLQRLRDIANIRYGLGQPPEEQKDGVPMIRATNIDAGRITDKDLLFVDRTQVPLDRNPYLKEDEIIVVRSGAYTGDSAIIPSKYVGAVAGYDMVVNVTHAEPKFIAYGLLSGYILEGQMLLLTLRAAQPHLNAEELGSIIFSLPPSRTEQQAIVSFLENRLAEISSIEDMIGHQVETLLAYRKSLIHECVTGKQRISEADVERVRRDESESMRQN